MNLPVIVLLAVFVLIAIRQVGRFRLRIWQVMLGGGVIVFIAATATGGLQASWGLILSINLDVILFLFGMFVIGEALHRSGYLFHLSHRIFRRARSVDALVLTILFAVGFFSALLMNDTLAIIGTPLMLFYARRFGLSTKLMLLTLAFAVTTGSVMSPIGNPQNLLIALNGGVPNPFVTFFLYLTVPTIINLFVAYAVLRLFFRKEFGKEIAGFRDEPLRDPRLARLCKAALLLVIALIVLKVALVVLYPSFEFRLTYIALVAIIPIVVFSRERVAVVRKIDWSTLVFFAAMFVLMAGVWSTGFFQEAIAELSLDLTSVPVILALSVLLSQLISNVPFVALYIPLLRNAGAGTREMMALATGSTTAGNMLPLGAASNVIIVQNAEREKETLTFRDFARVGVPLTILQILVYWAWLSII
ncbi:MAG: anion transporter [Euryarchaeota archaeon]|nr:anion transporter [Euryarchaeota archaeon]